MIGASPLPRLELRQQLLTEATIGIPEEQQSRSATELRKRSRVPLEIRQYESRRGLTETDDGGLGVPVTPVVAPIRPGKRAARRSDRILFDQLSDSLWTVSDRTRNAAVRGDKHGGGRALHLIRLADFALALDENRPQSVVCCLRLV